MTKEEYIVIRNGEEIPLSLFYLYYTETSLNNRNIVTLEEFEVLFPKFMGSFMGGAIITKNGVKYIDFQRIVAKVYNYFNKKYEI